MGCEVFNYGVILCGIAQMTGRIKQFSLIDMDRYIDPPHRFSSRHLKGIWLPVWMLDQSNTDHSDREHALTRQKSPSYANEGNDKA